MFDYYGEKWLDKLEDRFGTVAKTAKLARRLNEEGPKDTTGSVQEKCVVKALREIILASPEPEQAVAEVKEETKGKEKKKA